MTGDVRGTTLVELMLVIALLGMASLVVAVTLGGRPPDEARAPDSRARSATHGTTERDTGGAWLPDGRRLAPLSSVRP